MIKMTTELFNKFSTKQEELDSMIREKFNISEEQWMNDYNAQHKVALQVELHELINECHDVWKYWKQKAVNPDRILDELVDCIHFLHLSMNKHVHHNNEWKVSQINRHIPSEKTFKEVKEYVGEHMIVSYLTSNNDLYSIYGYLLTLANYYSFTLDDIEQAYDRKNAENHARQERGTY